MPPLQRRVRDLRGRLAAGRQLRTAASDSEDHRGAHLGAAPLRRGGPALLENRIQGLALAAEPSPQRGGAGAGADPAGGWGEIAGVSPKDIVAPAVEFPSHGKKAAADIHRGVSQHTNGFYNVFAWMSLNLLVGNFDWKGGMVKATAYDATGGGQGQPFPLSKMNPAKTSAFGISLIRHDQKFEETTIFKGYPAKRPWYPLSSDIYQEIMPSASDAYPYPIKILFLYMGTPNYSLPAGQTNIAIVSDVNKIPLFVTSDIIVGETSMYSDYIFPDLSYLERWEFQGSHPSVTQKVQPIRQPAIAPIPETVIVYGREQPISLEAMILGIAEKLGLPGFGKKAFGEGEDS